MSIDTATDTPDRARPGPDPRSPHDDRVRQVAGLVAIGALLLLVIASVAAVRQSSGDGEADPWGGVLLDRAQPRPDFTLTDTEGRPYDFGAETQGRLTLLFFGYTYCPDICPVQMAVLTGALESPGMPDPVVVFVTTDPARDTPERLRDWLDGFDPSYVGLYGTPEEIARAEAASGVAGSIRPGEAGGDDGSAAGDDYEVGHAAQVVAYTPDDRAHLVYPSGVRQQDWTADLPRMMETWG
jgi:protein SCO1